MCPPFVLKWMLCHLRFQISQADPTSTERQEVKSEVAESQLILVYLVDFWESCLMLQIDAEILCKKTCCIW